MTREFQIDVGTRQVKHVVKYCGQEKIISHSDYLKYSNREVEFEDLLETLETSAHSYFNEHGRVHVELGHGNRQGSDYTEAKASAYAIGEGGRAYVDIRRGKDETTESAAAYSEADGLESDPSLLKRLGHFLSTLGRSGSKDSKDVFGEDGKHILVTKPMQKALETADGIDIIRDDAYGQKVDEASRRPGSSLTRNSYYNGDEVRRKVLERTHGKDPAWYATGSALGSQQIVHSLVEGVSAKDFHVASQIQDRVPTLNTRQAIDAAQNTIQTFENGKLVGIQPSSNGELSIHDKMMRGR